MAYMLNLFVWLAILVVILGHVGMYGCLCDGCADAGDVELVLCLPLMVSPAWPVENMTNLRSRSIATNLGNYWVELAKLTLIVTNVGITLN